jgi:hypothetical protein
MLFDWLVTGQVVATNNPAHAVRGPKHVVKTGKTTVSGLTSLKLWGSKIGAEGRGAARYARYRGQAAQIVDVDGDNYPQNRPMAAPSKYYPALRSSLKKSNRGMVELNRRLARARSIPRRKMMQGFPNARALAALVLVTAFAGVWRQATG